MFDHGATSTYGVVGGVAWACFVQHFAHGAIHKPLRNSADRCVAGAASVHWYRGDHRERGRVDEDGRNQRCRDYPDHSCRCRFVGGRLLARAAARSSAERQGLIDNAPGFSPRPRNRIQTHELPSTVRPSFAAGFHFVAFMALVMGTGTLVMISDEIDWLFDLELRL